jgi:cytosine/adenosine deaminase-related metal-dependent hydrolase
MVSNRPEPASQAPKPISGGHAPGVGRIRALAAFDARGRVPAPGPVDVLVRWVADPPEPRVEVLALGQPEEVDAHPLGRAARRVDRSGCVLIPGLLNAHTHLDLTHIGPRPHDPAQGFGPWIDMIRRERLSDPAAIAKSVARGVELLRAGGTVAVGDIAGAVRGRPSRAALEALRATGMPGVSYIEYFGLTAKRAELLGALAEVVAGEREVSASAAQRVRLGLQPHAPYSVSLVGYAIAIEAARLGDGGGEEGLAGVPMCSHVAESLDERELIVHQRGPLRTALSAIVGDPSDWIDQFGVAESPVAHVLRAGWPGRPAGLAVHLNDLADADIARLREAGVVAVYCPRSSAYFAAERHFGPHRYRDLLAAGVPVALGTDSIVNLPPHAADPAGAGISILDEMRLLHRRDGTDAQTLLAMATINGLPGFPNLDPDEFTFPTPGGPERPMAGIVAVPLRPGVKPESWLTSPAGDAAPELLVDN